MATSRLLLSALALVGATRKEPGEQVSSTFRMRLTVIAVSDEDRGTVEQFLAKNSYSFPVALDAGRQVNKAFSVDGIPKTSSSTAKDASPRRPSTCGPNRSSWNR